MLALDIVRVEAGLILIDVDYTSSRRALIPEQAYSPFELGILGHFVTLDKPDFVGKEALQAEEASGGPARRLVGLEMDWDGIEALHTAQDLPPAVPPVTSREHVPLYSDRRQVGRVTSTTWSPILKKALALASVAADHSSAGTKLQIEWTVEAYRGRVDAVVVDLPFFNPPRKTAVAAPA
jgi:aminomethyltransferase